MCRLFKYDYLQYQRIVALVDDIPGISKIVSYNKPK